MRRPLASVALVATLAAACAGGEPSVQASSPTPEPAPELQTGMGVTAEPCPDGDPERGCIYLAVLSDLETGPFWPFGAAVAAGVEAYWAEVNGTGGIGGYDVDVTTYTRDTAFDLETSATVAAEVAEDVLAVALSLGTEPTLAAMDAVATEHPDLAFVPGSFWSGWWSEPRALPSGADYCTQVSNALDRATADAATSSGEGDPQLDLAVVHFDDLYGRDVVAGVQRWAERNAIPFDVEGQAIASTPGTDGTQDGAVEALLDLEPELIVVATGPLELASIVAKIASQDAGGRVIAPAVAFTPGVLDAEELAGPIQERVSLELPWAPWGADTPAHDRMGRVLLGQLPPNDGYTFGWIWSYPLHALLQAAAAAGDVSRAGLAAVRAEVEVDYQEALPARRLGGAPHVATLSAVPDAEAPLGVRALGELSVGPSASRDSQPCAAR